MATAKLKIYKELFDEWNKDFRELLYELDFSPLLDKLEAICADYGDGLYQQWSKSVKALIKSDTKAKEYYLFDKDVFNTYFKATAAICDAFSKAYSKKNLDEGLNLFKGYTNIAEFAQSYMAYLKDCLKGGK